MRHTIPTNPCCHLIALAALAGGALLLRATAARGWLGPRARDVAVEAGLRLLGASDGFVSLS